MLNTDEEGKGCMKISFEEFWREYPRKVGKLKAEKSWARHRLHHEKVMEGLHSWLNSLDWQDVQFIPYPATFLNSRRWEEQPTMPIYRSDPREVSAEKHAENLRLLAELERERAAGKW